MRLIGSTSMPAASDVAAGIINPVTGRWMTKSWQFDQLLPEAEATYRAIEEAFDISIYHPIPEIRFCQNSDDLKRLGRRMRNPRYQNVLGEAYAPGEDAAEFKNCEGSFSISQAAYVDLPLLVATIREEFSKQGILQDEAFIHSKLQRDESHWEYGAIRADKVIFCEGAAARSNPWFSELALKPVKGETLLCQSPSLKLAPMLYHHKKWFLPYPDGSFRIGATYDASDLSELPTEAQKEKLLTAAREALKESHEIQVTDHLAGIRPSSSDSRPIVGPHPSESGLYILNGLGSKGASTAPSMTRQLTEHILQNRPLDPEVDLARFKADTLGNDTTTRSHAG